MAGTGSSSQGAALVGPRPASEEPPPRLWGWGWGLQTQPPPLCRGRGRQATSTALWQLIPWAPDAEAGSGRLPGASSPVAVLPERPGIVSYQVQAGAGRGGGVLFFCPRCHSFLSSSVSVASSPPRRFGLCSWIKLGTCPSLEPSATHGPRGTSGTPPGRDVRCPEPHLCQVPQSRSRETETCGSWEAQLRPPRSAPP